jgi:hypothetical protein
MSNTNTGGPAFPDPQENWRGEKGMTLRQYAAIKLKVPDSGTDWLDDMIRESQCDYFAAKAMQGFMANKANPMHFQPENDAAWAYTIADAMLKAREE